MIVPELHLPLGNSWLLAVSGGMDSMCLLHMLTKQRKDDRIEVCIVHHGVRGKDADLDVELVQKLCEIHQLPCHVVRLDGSLLLGKGGFEARARAARYLALQEIRTNSKLEWICTAHHADDQVETLLLRILRGTGILGLRGIHQNRADGICRPLLYWSKEQVRDLVRTYQIPYREDLSNLDLRFKRNFIRHRLSLEIKALAPDYREQLLRIAGLAERVQPKIQAHLGDISANRAKKPTDKPIASIRPNLNMYLFEWNIRTGNCAAIASPQEGKVMESFSADLLEGDPVLRFRRDGDRFSPQGLNSEHRKLKKFLQEKGIPRSERDSLPLVVIGNEVLWIPGLAISGRHRITESTHRILELRLEEWKNR